MTKTWQKALNVIINLDSLESHRVPKICQKSKVVNILDELKMKIPIEVEKNERSVTMLDRLSNIFVMLFEVDEIDARLNKKLEK